MTAIAMIYNGVWSHFSVAQAPKYRDFYDLLYVHDIAPGNFDSYCAVVVPFQSHQPALKRLRPMVFEVLARGGKVFVEGDATWLDAVWEDRPVNNYWWVSEPDNPPAQETDFSHPVYHGLTPRRACWHTHGAYTSIPADAEVIQRNGDGDVVTWQSGAYGGDLLATTLDPFVEHGVQQIRHLDHYVDNLTEWLCGVRPAGPFTVDWRIGALPSAGN
jgi:hypothetical protein